MRKLTPVTRLPEGEDVVSMLAYKDQLLIATNAGVYIFDSKFLLRRLFPEGK